jgi:hypothetical protein
MIKFGRNWEKNGSKDTENEKKSAKNCHFYLKINQILFPAKKKREKIWKKSPKKGEIA